MERKSPRETLHRRSEAGMTLIETAIALIILFIATAGLMALGVVATMTTENEGHLAARATEYAQDKMEQMLALKFCEQDDDTTVFPTAQSGGSGLLVGGSSNPSTPVNLYVDYLDANGNPLGGGAVAPATWYYMRVWAVSTPGCTPPAGYCAPEPGIVPPPANFCSIKQITVTSKVRIGVGAGGRLAESTLTSLKSYPF